MKVEAKRVLIFAEAVTLAHVARCMAIADALNQRGQFQLILAVDERFNKIVGNPAYECVALKSITTEYFLKQLSKGRPIYDSEILTRYVKEDLEIIAKFKPDFIIGDFRLSLAISSKIAETPYASITNAYWSPYINIDYPIPDIPLTKLIGVGLAQTIFNLVRPIVFRMHTLEFNRTCKKFGHSPLSYDLRDVYTHADYTLYADIKSLFSIQSLPNNHLFIGPILWSAHVPLPDWWHSLPEDRPIIFVTLGSSGDATLLPMILETLSSKEVTVICVTAQKNLPTINYPNTYITEYLPAEAAVKKSDIVICNGGSPMVYQSLVEKKEVIGIPCNLDQYLMMTAVQKAKMGFLIRAGHANPKLISAAVNQALTQKSLKLAEKPILEIDKIEALIDSN